MTLETSIRWMAIAIGSLAVAIVIASVLLVLGAAQPRPTPPATSGADHAALCEEATPAGYGRLPMQQESMLPTIAPSDVLLIELAVPALRRGDIIVFVPPGLDAAQAVVFIKRVIAVAGDSVAIREGAVFVNGDRLDEPYAQGPTQALDDQAAWSVAGGQLFVLGDNRGNSTDSRSSTIGLISVESLAGKAVFRCAPAAQRGPITAPGQP